MGDWEFPQGGEATLSTVIRKLAALIRAGVGAVVMAATTAAVGVGIVWAGRTNQASPRIDRLVRIWSRVFLAVGGVRLEVVPGAQPDPDRSYVIVSNHLSDFDIPINFLTAPTGIRYLAKKELFRVPILGTVMRAMGIVRTDRQAGRLAHDEINHQIANVVGLGLSLMIYPEGTRARDGRLHPFKKGAFRIAIDNGMDVLPVALTGTYEAWKPGTPYVYGGSARVQIQEPISVRGLGFGDIEALRDQAYAAVAAGLERLQAA